MTVDVEKARALVSDLQRSSLFQTRLAGDTIAALLDERDALARDAARIQWLDEHALSMDAVADPDGFVWVWHGTDPARKIRGKTLREAIDRAMKGASDVR